jgi:molecular chaperone DnaK
MGSYIGIDLGTTYSAVAHIDETGRPVIIANPSKKDGGNITPSNVTVKGNKFIVGEVARKSYQLSDSSLGRFKRAMGTSKVFKLNGKDITPTELSTLVLKEMLHIASEDIGKVEKAVVTIPANFGNEAREATLQAAKNAGLDVEFTIDEPTAAALCYAFESGEKLDGHYVIYDLGGGTFDVSIISVSGQDIDVVASNGIQELGGDDFDKALQSLVRAKSKEATGTDLDDSEYTLVQAEDDKISLSNRRKCIAGGGEEMRGEPINIFRDEFEKSISSLLAQTEMMCETTLSDAELGPEDIKEIILVGGSTRMPVVRESVKRVFDKAPILPANVDEMVALGAALYAAFKSDRKGLNSSQKQSLKSIKISDVASHYFGTLAVRYNKNLDTQEHVNSIIIKKGDKIPCSVTEEFFTNYDGQVAVQCEITQSLSPETDKKFVNIIWEGLLELPPDRPAGQKINVTYSYDDNSMMHCVFEDDATGAKCTKTLDSNSKDADETDIDEKFLVD